MHHMAFIPLGDLVVQGKAFFDYMLWHPRYLSCLQLLQHLSLSIKSFCYLLFLVLPGFPTITLLPMVNLMDTRLSTWRYIIFSFFFCLIHSQLDSLSVLHYNLKHIFLLLTSTSLKPVLSLILFLYFAFSHLPFKQLQSSMPDSSLLPLLMMPPA